MSDHEFVCDEIERLLKNGITSGGKAKRRMVFDFSILNEQTIVDRYPMPDINMTLQNLGNANFFSKIDLESGYHQIIIRESDREKTAFSINGVKFDFVRMPFGLTNAPSIFQRCVDDILRPYIGKFAYVYMNGVLIFSNSLEEHLNHVKIIINALHNANMKLSNEKTHFFSTSIEYLGHVVKHG